MESANEEGYVSSSPPQRGGAFLGTLVVSESVLMLWLVTRLSLPQGRCSYCTGQQVILYSCWFRGSWLKSFDLSFLEWRCTRARFASQRHGSDWQHVSCNLSSQLPGKGSSNKQLSSASFDQIRHPAGWKTLAISSQSLICIGIYVLVVTNRVLLQMEKRTLNGHRCGLVLT